MELQVVPPRTSVHGWAHTEQFWRLRQPSSPVRASFSLKLPTIGASLGSITRCQCCGCGDIPWLIDASKYTQLFPWHQSHSPHQHVKIPLPADNHKAHGCATWYRKGFYDLVESQVRGLRTLHSELYGSLLSSIFTATGVLPHCQ